MSVFENAKKRHNVLENDPYDWEKCNTEELLTINAAAVTAQQLTRLTPAYLGYLQINLCGNLLLITTRMVTVFHHFLEVIFEGRPSFSSTAWPTLRCYQASCRGRTQRTSCKGSASAMPTSAPLCPHLLPGERHWKKGTAHPTKNNPRQSSERSGD